MICQSNPAKLFIFTINAILLIAVVALPTAYVVCR